MTVSLRMQLSVATGTVMLLSLAMLQSAGPARAQQPAAGAGADSAAIAATITQLTQKFSDALEANNTAVLDSMLAPDVWVVRPNGERHRKEEWIRSFAEKFHVTKNDLKSNVVHVHGNDVAVVVSENINAGTRHTGEAINNSTVGTVWVNRGGNWQIVLRTVTPLAQVGK